ncbi:MAG: hypothetical protein HC814_05710 [Rhodobacteraceae bacterium]|nr:hypothetical protein [Paracoccaceae bacterium]
MLHEIRDLGFEFAELSHGIRISLLPGILEAVDAGEIKISTLHNFCPLPIGITRAAPNIFKFTSTDPRERDSAFRQTIKTFDTAERVKSPTGRPPHGQHRDEGLQQQARGPHGERPARVTQVPAHRPGGRGKRVN